MGMFGRCLVQDSKSWICESKGTVTNHYVFGHCGDCIACGGLRWSNALHFAEIRASERFLCAGFAWCLSFSSGTVRFRYYSWNVEVLVSLQRIVV